MRAVVMAAVAALGLSGEAIAQQRGGPTADEIRQARRALVERLRNPDSAQFRDVRAGRLDNGTAVFCGEMNSTNGFGGYVGYQPFFVVNGTPVIAGRDAMTTEYYWYRVDFICGEGRPMTPVRF